MPLRSFCKISRPASEKAPTDGHRQSVSSRRGHARRRSPARNDRAVARAAGSAKIDRRIEDGSAGSQSRARRQPRFKGFQGVGTSARSCWSISQKPTEPACPNCGNPLTSPPQKPRCACCQQEMESKGIDFTTDVFDEASEAWAYFCGLDWYLYEVRQTQRPLNALLRSA